MSCPKWENDIALYAGGDLPASRLARTMAHLEACAGCRELADDLHAGQMLLSELRSEPVADAMAAQVRRRVMASLAAQPAGSAGRYWMWALAAGLVFAAILILSRQTAKPAKQARTQALPPRIVASALPPIVNAPRPAVRRHRRAAIRRAPPQQPGEPLLVQLVSDDPDIVIYWLVDPKPQGD